MMEPLHKDHLELEGELREAKREVTLDRERLEADERNKRKIEAELHGREVRIVVNTRPRTVKGPRVSFDDLVAFAFETVPTGPNIEFTISYRHGPHDKPDGTVARGQSVLVRDGEIFSVTYTDKS